MFNTKHRSDIDAIMKLATTRGDTGGLLKRIDENRELLELLLRDAPDFMARHFWVEGWIQGNDAFFVQLQSILQVPNHTGSTRYPRPWPQETKSGQIP